MDTDTCQRIIDLNRQFYQRFAQPFSLTRQRLQPGVHRILEHASLQANWLDLGCGNGELWRALASRGQRGLYLGVDFSAELLQAAEQRLPVAPADFPRRFIQADLTSGDWAEKIPLAPLDVATAFAVMHHLPGKETRLRFLQQVRRLIAPTGRVYLSNWQFLNSKRLRERIQPWEAIGLSQDRVEPGDYLLDWRQGGHGLRYVHHFDHAELSELADESGFRILETFYSDGEGGRLSIYQTWEPVE